MALSNVQLPVPPPGDWHALTALEVVKALGSNAAQGLTDEDAAARLNKDGPNSLATPEKTSIFTRIARQFTSPIVLTLIAAAVVALVHGASTNDAPLLVRFGDAIAIGFVIVLNAVLGVTQEQRAETTLDALKKLQVAASRVVRGGRSQNIPAADLVVGDILELEAGDAVPADARVVESTQLAADESSLTGESIASEKEATADVAGDASLGDRETMLFSGTSIMRGKARAVVVATGESTELGRISQMIVSADADRTTPLERQLDTFGKRVLAVCLTISALLFAHGMWRGGRHWTELLLEAISVAVAAIPEGLPAITTITLALGTQRMAQRGAIVRKLAAVETLGAATVICSDKTGTLTKNEMTVREVFAGGERFGVTGAGYAPDGEILDESGSVISTRPSTFEALIASAVLCNSASINEIDGAWRVVGDPTEGALLTLGAKVQVHRETVHKQHTIVVELPFDSDRKRMTVVARTVDGDVVAHTKGASDILLPLCSVYAGRNGDEPMTDSIREMIAHETDRMSALSLRVIAVARRNVKKSHEFAAPSSVPQSRQPEIEEDLTFLGLVGMIDPPRHGVKEAVETCRLAGVRAVMITGDHKVTAIAIAREIGIWASDAVAISGSELAAMGDDEFNRVLPKARVFARVTAEQKVRIVRALKAAGEVVAMTGDGVNDAPALREAHIGVAMGRVGTDVARQAADIVISDDNFATIVDAVREGRAVYTNIQKFIYFLLSSNAGLIVAVTIAAVMPGVPPLTPLMILWINLVTNGLPALALGVDPPTKTQMHEPPRRASEPLLRLDDVIGIAVVGVAMGAAAIACYFVGMPGDAESAPYRARALAFSLLALSPLFHAFSCRSKRESVFTISPRFSKPLLLAAALSAAIHFTAILIPSLRPIFRTFPMSATEWTFLLLMSASILPIVELMKVVRRAIKVS